MSALFPIHVLISLNSFGSSISSQSWAYRFWSAVTLTFRLSVGLYSHFPSLHGIFFTFFTRFLLGIRLLGAGAPLECALRLAESILARSFGVGARFTCYERAQSRSALRRKAVRRLGGGGDNKAFHRDLREDDFLGERKSKALCQGFSDFFDSFLKKECFHCWRNVTVLA